MRFAEARSRLPMRGRQPVKMVKGNRLALRATAWSYRRFALSAALLSLSVRGRVPQLQRQRRARPPSCGGAGESQPIGAIAADCSMLRGIGAAAAVVPAAWSYTTGSLNTPVVMIRPTIWLCGAVAATRSSTGLTKPR